MPINTELLEILACPKCQGELLLLADSGCEEGLECTACALVYPIREEIPVMLIEEAVSLSEWQAGVRAVEK